MKGEHIVSQKKAELLIFSLKDATGLKGKLDEVRTEDAPPASHAQGKAPFLLAAAEGRPHAMRKQPRFG
jgi:hypothetical protein